MKWQRCLLGDFITLKRGHDLPEAMREDGSVPIVSSSGITGYHREPKARAPGVVTGRYGTLGKVFYVEQDYWPLNTALYVVDFKGNDARFVAYYLEYALRNYQSDKAAIPGIDRNVLHKLPITVPDEGGQRVIADILVVYDKHIDNNKRRIALLHEAAREIYNEWFVRLRFPGYEHTKVKDGVPAEWGRLTAFDVMDIMSGGTPKTNVPDYWDGPIPFYTPKDSTEESYVIETEKTITDTGLAKCHSKLFPKDTVFITARGTVGNINLAQKPMAMNQSCYALSAKRNVSQHFLYCSLRESVRHFKQHASGAVFDAIIVDTFKLIPMLIPSPAVLDLFDLIVRPIFGQIENLLLQNLRLAEARSILLPKLVSGDIEILV